MAATQALFSTRRKFSNKAYTAVVVLFRRGIGPTEAQKFIQDNFGELISTPHISHLYRKLEKAGEVRVSKLDTNEIMAEIESEISGH